MSLLIKKISENIKAFPDFTVVYDTEENNSFTYAEFDEYARKIASKLLSSGIEKNDFVTIELPRSKEYIAAIYAAWLVGAAYAPLSPTYPEERLEYIRNDCDAKLNIDEKFLRGIESEAVFDGVIETGDDDPALLIYTSGSFRSRYFPASLRACNRLYYAPRGYA